jgi:hypothetical protein
MSTIGTFHTPPRNQGQIVIVSYTQIDGVVIRRTHDQSDQTTTYATSRAKISDEGDYWNGEPDNQRWKSVSSDEVDRMLDDLR